MGRVAAVVLLVGLCVSACAGGEDPAPKPDSKTATSTTPDPATEAQVASVIAGYEKDWREVIRKAGDCRFSNVMKDPGQAAKLDRISCYLGEVTAGVTAAAAVKDLDALVVPVSLTTLVTETKNALGTVAGVDLESVCGPAMAEPNDSRRCSLAFGSRMIAYQSLETALDKWSPYL